MRHYYGHFAPASWLMERDIVEARKAMNLSLWDSYSADQQQTLGGEDGAGDESRMRCRRCSIG
jgi:hypothetical protein